MRMVSKAEKLLEALAGQALWEGFRKCSSNPASKYHKNPSPPGEFIERLSEEDRETLKALKSEDIATHYF